jgi:hypothetical protein
LKLGNGLVGDFFASMTDMDTPIDPGLYLYFCLLEEGGSRREIELVKLVLMPYGEVILYLSVSFVPLG